MKQSDINSDMGCSVNKDVLQLDFYSSLYSAYEVPISSSSNNNHLILQLFVAMLYILLKNKSSWVDSQVLCFFAGSHILMQFV